MYRRDQAPAGYSDIDDPSIYVFYRYDPSVIAAIISTIFFLTTTSLHILQAGKHRTYYFIPFILGGFFDTVGYIGRALAHYYPYNVNVFIMQELLLLLAPALYAASIYMTLGQIIMFTHGENLAPIPARWLTKIFVCGDMLSFVFQSAGGGLMASRGMALGEHLVTIGLYIQIVSFGIFVVTGGVFHYRLVRMQTPASIQLDWQRYIYTLYAASILIFLRSIFRVVEFSGGNAGALMRNEMFLYVFEGVMMWGVMVSFNIIHPGNLTGRRPLEETIILSRRDAMELGSKGSSRGSDSPWT